MSIKITPQSDSNLDVTLTESDNLISLDLQPASIVITGAGLGTVTQVLSGTGLTGGPITQSGTLAIDATVATLVGAQALTNKTGLISQWTNDAGYITSETDNQTLSFANPNISISSGNTVDLSALSTTSLAFSAITSTPTTLAGYGITDGAGGAGTVTSIIAGTGLSGGTITSTGTVAIDSTVATLTGAQELTNKTGVISQWTNAR